MKKVLSRVIVVFAVALGGARFAQAEEPVPLAVPVNFYACSYMDGKNMSDFREVIEKFDRFATRYDAKYSAWTLTPSFYTAKDYFDVGWMGTWPNGKEYGESQDNWVKHGGEMIRAFDEVVDCTSTHQELISSVVVYSPDGPPANGVVMFAPCTLLEGKTLNDAYQASKTMADIMVGMGSKANQFMFYPSLGSGEIDFDFWRVTTFNNYTELGIAADTFYNGGGWNKTREILGSVASCGSPTVYDANLARSGNTRTRDRM
jgi:hypothetical protein